MSMKVEKTENANELKLTFTVPAEKFDEGMKRVYAKSAKYFTVPGFRRGKAPMALVERNYGSEIFYEDTFNEIVPEIFENEITENKIDVVSKPQIDIVEIGKGKDLVFTAIVQTKPVFKLLKSKYKGIALQKVEYVVTDETINGELEQMADRNSRLLTIEDDDLKAKDISVIDFEGYCDGKKFEGGSAEKYELEIGSNRFIPGFEDQLIGMKIGEEKEINVKFPEDYPVEELAGKDAMFKVKLHEIHRKELPKIDDEFAKDVSEFETLEELKNSIKEKLQKEYADKEKQEIRDNAMKAVSNNVEIDIPSGMIESEIDSIISDIKNNLSYSGLNIDRYLQMIGKTEAELREQYKEQAETTVKGRLILEAIVKSEKIEPTDEEVGTKIKDMADRYGRKADELKENEQLVKYIKDNLAMEKAVDFVVENAKIK